VPTLFISCEHDPAANPTVMGPMVAAVAGSKLAVIPDAGHISNMENPPPFNAALTEFLNNL
jgi:pimeloyl-ACP methyl ester carboxylesterase